MRWWVSKARTLAAPAAAILLVALGTQAHAKDEPTAPSEPSARASNKPAAATSSDLGHRHQFGLSVRMGSGYRVIAPYTDGQDCGESDSKGAKKSICGGMVPLWLELSPSFGITDSLELIVDVRIPLDKPTYTDAKGFFVSPGIKYFTDPQETFKLFLTAQVVFENQSQSANPGLASFDFGVRSALGVNFDVVRYVGLYAQAGLIFGFTRWMSFLVDFGGGVQIRY